jgi:outer membrane protein OmpA-like peptidoglycan-associated protein
VEDLRFDFDSSFVKPELAEEVAELRKLRDRHKKDVSPQPGAALVSIFPPLSIFGHADPTGGDDYNKQLSGRRATAIYAMLVRDSALWNKLYDEPLGNDKWGPRAIQDAPPSQADR